VAVVIASAPTVVGADEHVVRAEALPLEERRLPEVVNAPGTWSTEEGVHGPVAALGLAMRTRTKGVFGARESIALFAVSAADGSASWIRLPGFDLQRWGFVGGFAVSPDGRWLGWVRPGRSDGSARVAGWSVMDTTTGRIRRLEDPAFSSVRGTMADLAFSGDSRYLLTSYETPDRPNVSRSRAHQLVAWDVRDGTPTVVEEPGHYWLPNLGSAPSGVVWARGHEVFRADPVTGAAPTSVTLPEQVVTAAWGPDGAGFAYVSRSAERPRRPWHLHVGQDVDQARTRTVDLPADVSVAQILGWRDATHVVVGHFRSSVHVVDIVTGEVERIDMTGYGKQMNAPYLAGALWQNPLAGPVEPEGTSDPRRPWRWAGAVALVTAALAWTWGRRHAHRGG
jgi:hypothetical protein